MPGRLRTQRTRTICVPTLHHAQSNAVGTETERPPGDVADDRPGEHVLASHRPGPHGHPATPTRRARARLGLPLAIDTSTDAAADGIRPDFYCRDEVYGSGTQLHEHFEATGQAYVLRVRRDDLEDLYGDPLTIWRDWASDVRGHGIDSGHHMAEEAPEALAASLGDFFIPGRARSGGANNS
jgi:hypothetical protein